MKIEVKVQPNSGREEIQKIFENNVERSGLSQGEVQRQETDRCLPKYKVFLKKPAEKNKANIELLKILKKHFGVEVKLISGKTSKNKIVEVKNEKSL